MTDAFTQLSTQVPDGFGALLAKSNEAAKPELEKQQAAEEEFAKQKADVMVAKAKEIAKSKQAGIGGEMAVYKKYDKELMAPAPTIQYSPDTAQGMQSLAVLLPLAGAMMGGKGLLSGIGAMNAMSGVLEGHRQGNQDRIALEQKNFEQKMNEWKIHMEQVKGAFDRALQMAKLNASGAQAQLEAKLAELDAPLLLADVKRNGISNAAQRNLNTIDKMTTMIEQAQSRLYSGSNLAPVAIVGKDGKPELITRQEFDRRRAAGETMTPAPTGRAAGDAYGFNEIVTTAANEAAASINNIVTMSPEVSTGLFGGRTTTNLFTAPLDALTNTLTSESVQRYNVEINNFGKFIAQLQKGGRAVTNADILNSSAQFAIKTGDKPLTVLTRLAEMRQAAERAIDVRIASPKTPDSLKQILLKNKEDIQNAIPFTVNEVNKFAAKQNESDTFLDIIKDFQKESKGGEPELQDGWSVEEVK
jgi:hypothetical protein